MQRILNDIASGQIASFYFLCGEAFPRDQIVAALRAAIVGDPATAAFCFDLLDGKKLTARDIIATASTVPMLGGRRLVQVHDAHELSTEQLALLTPYIADQPAHAVLLMTAAKADLRKKFFTAAKKHGHVVRFDPLKDREAPRWVADLARQRKIRLEPGVPQTVVDAVGVDMGQLADALERLSLYVGPDAPVTVGAVEEAIAHTRQHSIFELTNAVGSRNRREAMGVLRRMMESREPGLRIVAMLARHVRQLWSAKELAGKGTPAAEMASVLGVHPYFVRGLLEQAGRFDTHTLKATHRELCEVDRALKSSKLPDAALLDRLVLHCTR